MTRKSLPGERIYWGEYPYSYTGSQSQQLRTQKLLHQTRACACVCVCVCERVPANVAEELRHLERCEVRRGGQELVQVDVADGGALVLTRSHLFIAQQLRRHRARHQLRQAREN